MGDEEVFVDEEIGGGDAGGGGKPGFVPAAILKILKWVALGLAAIIFIVTVVFITVSVMTKGPKAEAYPSPSEAYQQVQPILQWYDVGEIRTRTSDENPATVIVSIKLGYDMDNKTLRTRSTSAASRLWIRHVTFFQEAGSGVERQLRAAAEERIERDDQQDDG